MKLPSLTDREQIEALFVYLLMLLAAFLGLALVVVTAAGLKGAAVIGTLAGVCITSGVGILAIRTSRRNGRGDE